MTANVKASCPACGDLEFPADAVTVREFPAAPDRNFYAFTCSKCHDRVQKPAGPDIIRLFVLGGVPIEKVTIPAEALQAEDYQTQFPPLTYDDILDFRLELDQMPESGEPR